ncbi:MAG: serine/threonine protein kinase [Planctomycetota bacterium]|nr:MAG: serine/threonine protein kinase [Planctomycetota bacterium]REK29623.1 MAG: serine/threonine protein kinase [Planctomycetota bacterium]
MHHPSHFDEDLIRGLPLPIALLFRRAENAKTPLERHQAAYYTWEASLKLLSSVVVAEYADLITDSDDHDPEVAARLKNLARPALGHWWEYVRSLTPVFRDRGDAGFTEVYDVLFGSPRDDLPRSAGLDAALRDALSGQSGARTTVRLSELFDRLVQYRNRELGHGALGQRSQDHYDRMGRAILNALEEIFGKLDLLAGRRLVYVDSVHANGGGDWEVSAEDLSVEAMHRMGGLRIPHTAIDRLPAPEHVYAFREMNGTDSADGPSFVSMHPLVLFDEELGEALFLNSRRGKQQIEYVSYVSGEVSRRDALAGDHLDLLARVLDVPVDPNAAEKWAQGAQQEDAGEADEAPAGTRRVGEFEVMGKIGVGAMGDVYRAWQPSLGRQVALKCMRRVGDARAEARFAREIRALGRVEHPHLVRIFTSGSEGEHWFYAMELVEGATLSKVLGNVRGRASEETAMELSTWQESLDSACAETRNSEASLSKAEGLSSLDSGLAEESPQTVRIHSGSSSDSMSPAARSYIDQVVELIRQVCEATAALHQANIIHRDIKPDNIMVTPDGARTVLMDLGLAKLTDDNELSRTREFIGTLRYASPEQVLAVGQIDFASDVYSIGAVLWEMLAMQAIYKADNQTTTAELMKRIQFQEPERLRKLNPRIPKELEAVVLKCLEKDPQRRYGSARELADDLSRWQRGAAVTAKSRSAASRFVHRLKRHRAQFGWAAVMLLVVGALFFWTSRPDPHRLARLREIEQLIDSVTRFPPAMAEEPHESRTMLAELPPPDRSAFETVEYLRICDLRNWTPLAEEEQSQPGSAVVIMQRERIRKLADQDEIRLQTATSGYDVYLRCEPHPESSYVPQDFHVLGRMRPTQLDDLEMKTRQLVVDVSDVRSGQVFGLQGVYTYWNAFQRDDQRWTGTQVHSQAVKVAFLAIMPDDRPFTRYRLEVRQREGEPFESFDGEEIVFEDPDHQFIYWEIHEPQPGAFYRIAWDW